MKILVVIDLQRAFINSNTEYLVRRIEDLVNSGKFDKIIFTKFINYEDSIYTSKLGYNRCISYDDQSIMIDTRDNIVINKYVYTAYNDEFINNINKDSDIIYLCGIDTECCVLKTSFDLFENGYDVKVLKEYSGSTHGEESNNYMLEVIGRSIGKGNVIQ